MVTFRGYAAPGQCFVIEGDNLPLPDARTFDYYRAQAVWERLSAWLKAHGRHGPETDP
jgi:hypothetical protein